MQLSWNVQKGSETDRRHALGSITGTEGGGKKNITVSIEGLLCLS